MISTWELLVVVKWNLEGLKVAVGANQTAEKVKHFQIVSLVGKWNEKEGTVFEAVVSLD